MFNKLRLRIALIIFISCMMVLSITISFVYFNTRNYTDNTILKELNGVFNIDVNTSATAINQLNDTTVFIYFDDSTTPYTQQKLYESDLYQQIFDSIIEEGYSSGRLEIDDLKLAYKAKQIYYWQDEMPVLCYEYVIYDYTDLNNYSVQLLYNIGIGGLIGSLTFMLLSILLSYWFVRPIKRNYEREKKLISDASHELKTPVAIVLSNLDVIKEHKNESVESQKEWLDSISNQSERMKIMIQELLESSKLDDMVIEKELFDLSSLVDETILTIESYAFEHNVMIESDIDENVSYLGHSFYIERLISILLDNAIKYNNEEGKIFVALKKDGKHLVLKIKNTGPTIDPENIDKIFDRFFKEDNVRNQHGKNSFGLGLSIAKSIVDFHQGKIEVESSDNITTFTITL